MQSPTSSAHLASFGPPAPAHFAQHSPQSFTQQLAPNNALAATTSVRHISPNIAQISLNSPTSFTGISNQRVSTPLKAQNRPHQISLQSPFLSSPGSLNASPISAHDAQVGKVTGSNATSSDSESSALRSSVESKGGVDETDSMIKPQYLTAKYSSPVGTPYATPMGTPGSTPAATPNTTPNPLQGIGSFLTPPNPPTPPTRSQTPSPSLAWNKKAQEMYSVAHKSKLDAKPQSDIQHRLRHQERSQNQVEPQKYESNSFPCESKPQKSQLTRRPSIQKLKELFEINKSGDSVLSFGRDGSSLTPPTNHRLSRSASSVTLRNSTLSLHNDKENKSVKLRRKPGLGSEESLNTLHASPINVDSVNKGDHLTICPPPPPLFDQGAINNSTNGAQYRNIIDHNYVWSKEQSVQNLRVPHPNNDSRLTKVIKPPSNSIHTNLDNSSQNHAGVCRVQSNNISNEERPALPIKIKKKSKSFRYDREAVPSKNSRSPQFSRKGISDVNTYFSLDRAKQDGYFPNSVSNGMSNSITGATGNQIKYSNGSAGSSSEMPSPREGFKLSVFQSNSESSFQHNGMISGVSDNRPEIPPKKCVQDKLKSPASDVMPNSFKLTSSAATFENKLAESLIGSRHQIISTYDNTSTMNNIVWKSQSSDSEQSLYDQLPSSSSNDTQSGSRKSDINRTPPINNSLLDSKSSKEYVNARLVSTKDAHEGERLVYVPLPIKRQTTDSSARQTATHDYANFIVKDDNQVEYLKNTETTNHGHEHFNATESKTVSSPSKSFKDGSQAYEDVCDMPSNTQGYRPEAKNYANSHFINSMKALKTPVADKSDYEQIDFGENSEGFSEGETVEVVNRELVGENYVKRKDVDCISNASSIDLTTQNNSTEVLLHNSLDPIARQVYQDCEDYLLYGTNKSPVPSLMPNKHDTNSLRSSRSSASRSSELLSVSPQTNLNLDEILASSPRKSSLNEIYSSNSCTGDSYDKEANLNNAVITEVTNKINVTPQGLRTRERRNSYRQAVNPVANNWKGEKLHSPRNDPPGKLLKIGPNIMESVDENNPSLSAADELAINNDNKKVVHKYETIWFEKTRETSRSDENLRLTRSVVEDSLTKNKPQNFINARQEWEKFNSLEDSVRDKEVKLVKNNKGNFQGFVNSLERGRVMKDIDVYSSLNVSKNSSSSVSSDKSSAIPSSVNSYPCNNSVKEPIYVNTSELRAATQQQPYSLPHTADHETPLASVKSNSRKDSQLHQYTSSKQNALLNQTGSFSKENLESQSSNSSRDSDTFPLIPKPSGPFPTTPNKQSSRPPTAPYTKILTPKGLGNPVSNSQDNVWVPMNSNSNSGANSCKSTPQEFSHGSDYSISRSLPPYQQPNSNSHKANPENQHKNARDISEPIYNVPYNSKQDYQKSKLNHPPYYNSLQQQPYKTNVSPSSTLHNAESLQRLKQQQQQQQQKFAMSSIDVNGRNQHNIPKGGHISRSMQQMGQKAHIVGDIAIVGECFSKTDYHSNTL